MLIGLVSKNGILIVEFANQRKHSGMSKIEAIKNAAAARFRPILMTSLATILGIMPLALGLGEGARSRVAMGIAVVGVIAIGDVVAYSSSVERAWVIKQEISTKPVRSPVPKAEFRLSEYQQLGGHFFRTQRSW